MTTTVEVKRVISGNKFKTEPEGYVTLAGIRAPFKNEPLGNEAIIALSEIIDGQQVRLRFGDDKRDNEDRWSAFVFVKGRMANEKLVRDGLAYARIRPGDERFMDLLIDAQAEAREEGRGLWGIRSDTQEDFYIPDTKHGIFHRPSCPDAANIPLERQVDSRSFDQTIGSGLAPCGKCNP